MRTGRNVDKFLTAILRTGAKNDYLEFTEKVQERHNQEQTSVRMMQNLKKKYQEA